MSTVAHSAAIGIAVVATAHARIEDKPPREVVRWVEPPVAARLADPASVPRPLSTRIPSTPRIPALALDRIDVVLPPIELVLASPAHTVTPLAGGETTPGPTADSAASGSTEPFSPDQVERQVSLRQGSRPPRYPAALRASGIDGEVIALFVVSEAGRVEPASVRFVRSDHVLFEAAVREALDAMRFNPAEAGRKRVRQLVQMPFVFTLSR
jgi:protein TonB